MAIKKEFLDYCRINASESTMKKIEAKYNHIENYFEDKINKLTIKDIHNFLRHLNEQGFKIHTQNDIKKILKRFLKWRYKDYRERFNNFDDIKSKKHDNKKQDLLNKDEIEKVLRACNSVKHTALINLLWESGARPSETLGLKWKDFEEDSKTITIYSSKNNTTRKIPLNKSIITLKDWKQKYSVSNPTKEDLIFPSQTDYKKPMSTQAVSQYIRNLLRKTLNKNHSAYSIRHTRCNIWFNSGMNAKDYEYVADHSYVIALEYYQQSDMKRLAKKFDEIYNIKELTPEEKEEIKKLREENKKIKKDFKDFTTKAVPEIIEQEVQKAMDTFKSYQKEYRKLTKEKLNKQTK